jgi:hypothetical protein
MAASESQDRRDVLAGLIAIMLGMAMIAYGCGWNLHQASMIGSIAAAFGSTIRPV